MKCMVTGGAGFVGRRFVRRLLNDGHEVTIVDDLSTGLPLNRWPAFLQPTAEQLERLNFPVACDLRDYMRFDKHPGRFDLVIHLAAVVGGRVKIEGDPIAVATDLAIDADFFQWIVRDPRKKVIYFSSSAVYPLSHQQQISHEPLAESLIDWRSLKLGQPDMTYGWSKLTGELLARHAVETYGLDVSIYRPFSGYGADQSLDYPFPSIIKRVLEVAEGKSDTISVWGDGNQVRDFIYIEDVVDIVMATYNQLKPGEALNLGSGNGVSFRNLAAMAHTVLVDSVFSCDIVCDTSKPTGVFYRVADISKLRQFGWKPSVSLEEGIQRVANYLRTTDRRFE